MSRRNHFLQVNFNTVGQPKYGEIIVLEVNRLKSSTSHTECTILVFGMTTNMNTRRTVSAFILTFCTYFISSHIHHRVKTEVI